MVLFVWLVIAAVALAVGVLLWSMDRRARRKGHVIRGASEIAAVEFSRRTNMRRPGVRPTAPRTRSKYPKL
jgi:Flp pilus assembly protein TadB